jgi:hypothetical protein
MIGLGHPEGRIRGKSDELYGTSDELYYDKGSCLVWIMEGDGKNGWHLLGCIIPVDDSASLNMPRHPRLTGIPR